MNWGQVKRKEQVAEKYGVITQLENTLVFAADPTRLVAIIPRLSAGPLSQLVAKCFIYY